MERKSVWEMYMPDETITDSVERKQKELENKVWKALLNMHVSNDFSNDVELTIAQEEFNRFCGANNINGQIDEVKMHVTATMIAGVRALAKEYYDILEQ